jgi:alpha-ribazole phosphatase
MADPGTPFEVWAWRHPRVAAAAGRCIGRTDLRVDARRAKRLAHRIEDCVRRNGLARVVWTSPLLRCAAVGRALRRRGFTHHVDPRLAELDFGGWDGRAWSTIAPADVAGWEADFMGHAPGGGEPLVQLLARARAFVAERAADGRLGPLLVVAHAGWINALRVDAAGPMAASAWPAAPAHGSLVKLRPASPGAGSR